MKKLSWGKVLKSDVPLLFIGEALFSFILGIGVKLPVVPNIVIAIVSAIIFSVVFVIVKKEKYYCDKEKEEK